MAEPWSVLSVSRAFLAVSRHFGDLLHPKYPDQGCASALESCSDPAYFHRLLYSFSLHAYCAACYRVVLLAPLEANEPHHDNRLRNMPSRKSYKIIRGNNLDLN